MRWCGASSGRQRILRSGARIVSEGREQHAYRDKMAKRWVIRRLAKNYNGTLLRKNAGERQRIQKNERSWCRCLHRRPAGRAWNTGAARSAHCGQGYVRRVGAVAEDIDEPQPCRPPVDTDDDYIQYNGYGNYDFGFHFYRQADE